jgi:hypothetical protein
VSMQPLKTEHDLISGNGPVSRGRAINEVRAKNEQCGLNFAIMLT